jgi:hypothetical protein
VEQLPLVTPTPSRVTTTSTAASVPAVKAALIEKLHHDVLPALEQLVAALLEALTEVAQAERQIRAGALAAARSLLTAWGPGRRPRHGPARVPALPAAHAP